MVSHEPYGSLIRDMIAQNLSYADISMNLLELGVQQGCSEMSVMGILCTSQHFQEGTCIRFTFYIPYRLGLHVKIYDDLSDRINIWPKDDDWIPVCNESGCW